MFFLKIMICHSRICESTVLKHGNSNVSILFYSLPLLSFALFVNILMCQYFSSALFVPLLSIPLFFSLSSHFPINSAQLVFPSLSNQITIDQSGRKTQKETQYVHHSGRKSYRHMGRDKLQHINYLQGKAQKKRPQTTKNTDYLQEYYIIVI